MAGELAIHKKKRKRGKRGRQILKIQEKRLLIDYMEPLDLTYCTKDELNISVFRIEEYLHKVNAISHLLNLGRRSVGYRSQISFEEAVEF